MVTFKQYVVKNKKLCGKIEIPPSKSHTLRAILFASLADGVSIIKNYLLSKDAEAMIDACRLFGAKIDVSETQISVTGLNGKIAYTEDVINARNSGIVLRFCAAIGALGKYPIVITGDESIRHQRPMRSLLEGLSELGASAVSMRGDGYAPVIIQGPIKSSKVTIFGEDSQPVSALLIAAAFANHPIEICVENPGEKPWIALTLHWLKRLNIPYEHCGYEKYQLFGNATYSGFEYTVPGDLSSAAFPIAAAIVTQSELTITNIDMSDPQGDKELISIFQKMGANIEIDEKHRSLQVKKGSQLSGIKVDINNFIDAITILAVVACFAKGETLIENASVAKQKECNRIACTVKELRKMGANISETEDGLLIKKSKLHGAEVYSHCDHRMAMSLTVAALGAEDITTISDIECIAKTYPSFLKDFNSIGAGIKEII